MRGETLKYICIGSNSLHPQIIEGPLISACPPSTLFSVKPASSICIASRTWKRLKSRFEMENPLTRTPSRTSGRLCVTLFFSLLCGSSCGQNVVFFFADDAGLEGGVFGHPAIDTPNLDALGRRSLVFRHAFTPVSSCSPSRASLLTGLPVHQSGLYGLHHDVHHFNVFDHVWSLPKILHHHDIRTGIIGKKHVGPEEVFPFDFAHTEENSHINQVGRNITHIHELVQAFLDSTIAEAKPFFLYLPFHDPHRCGHTSPQLGGFCEKFGDHVSGFGRIPDWNPIYYAPDQVLVPDNVPDTPATREEIAKQYTAISRMDQGIGLVMHELSSRGLLHDTMVIYSSDNGIPFPNGRTNLYDSGIHQPLLISSPFHEASHGQSCEGLVSLLDLVPTLLDWYDLDYPKYKILHNQPDVTLTGRSLLPQLENPRIGPNDSGWNKSHCTGVFGSHNLHEVTMYYPMRYIRTKQYKLIHNIAHSSLFPIDQDFFLSKSLQDLLWRSEHGFNLNWTKTWQAYLHRPEWELFNVEEDPKETRNLIEEPDSLSIFQHLRHRLLQWQNHTQDPWICAPGGVLEDKGDFKGHPKCLSYIV